jgi:type IV pilus assembly protein PilE
MGTKQQQSGVTLLELMIVVGIVGVLAGIAYPSYRAQVMRSYRTEARSALLQSAQKLERCFTRSQTYDNCITTLPFLSEQGHYSINFVAADTNFALDTYRLLATRQDSQVADTDCGDLSIDQSNRRAATGTLGNAACWR